MDPKRCEAGDPYSSGVSKTGSEGVKVTLQDVSPSAAIVGYNTWTLVITDSGGQPLDDATLKLAGTMPLHEGHGSPVEPQTTPMGNGTYEVERVNFNMGGTWSVKVAVTKGDLQDSVTFKFCVVE